MPPLNIMFADEIGNIIIGPAIEYEDALWLVLDWISLSEGKLAKPKRMILIDRDTLLALAPEYPADYLLTEQVTRAVQQGESNDNWIVLEEPEIILEVRSPH